MEKDKLVEQIEKIALQAKFLMKKKNREKEIENVDNYLKRVRCQDITVLVCGEFKRGKSSFINAFLEESLCPVDVAIATSAVTIIRYGEKLRITRRYGNLDDLQSEELASPDDIERYVKGSAEEIDNTVMVVVELPNEKLKSGIVLIDTPGVGGLDPRHAFLTTYFLPKADITLFITDPGEPVTATEIGFFQTKIAAYAKEKAIIVNKADKFANEQQMAAWVEDARTKFTPGEMTELRIIPVSAMLKMSYLKTKDELDLEESNFVAVERTLEGLVNSFRRLQLVNLRDYICRVLTDIAEPIKVQIDQIKVPDPGLLVRFERDLKSYQEQKERLSNPSSEYRMKVASIVKQARADVEIRLQEESVLLSSNRLQELVASPLAKANPRWLLTQLNNGIGSIASELDAIIDAAFEQVMEKLGASRHEGVRAGKFDFTIDVNLTPAEKSLSTVACNTARQALPGLGIFALTNFVVGGIATALTGGTFPLIVAGAAALGFVAKNASDASKREDALFFQTQLAPQVAIAMKHLSAYINNRFDDFNTELIAALQQGTQKLIDDMDGTIKELNKLKMETVQQKQKKARLLEEELKPVEQVLGVAKIFLTNPFARKEATAREKEENDETTRKE